MWRKALALAFGLALGAAPALAQTSFVVSAGPPGSVPWIVAGDLAEVGRACGAEIDVLTSEGTITSLEKMHEPNGADAAILQGDVLDYLQSYRGQDPKIARAIEGVELAVPLFRQELQIVAGPGVAQVRDLAGKRVNFGPLTSGGFLTATIVFDFLGVEVGEATRLPEVEALAEFAAGRLDAVVLVDAVPSRLLLDAGLAPGQARLLTVEDPFLAEVYDEVEIPGGVYDFEPEPRRSVAVRSYLMTRAAPIQSPLCNRIADTVAIITRQRQLLAGRGHRKWHEVDETDLAPDWPVSACAVAGLDPGRPLACQ